MSAAVWLVDDDAPVLAALADVLTIEGLGVRPFDSAESFLAAIDGDSAGCIVLDIRLPGLDGLQAHAALRAAGILMPVIFLTGHGDVPMSVRAIRDGAHDFLQKPVAADTLLASVRSALQLDEQRRAEAVRREGARTRVGRLTPREREVTALLLQCRTTKEVARLLGTSPRTVEAHRRSIMLKAQVASVLELERLFLLAEAPPGRR
jgi:FixJ family two-component response regulator